MNKLTVAAIIGLAIAIGLGAAEARHPSNKQPQRAIDAAEGEYPYAFRMPWAGNPEKEEAATGPNAPYETKVLLKTRETVLGQEIDYPSAGPAEVTAAVVTLAPGEVGKLHLHEAPMFAYILEGDLTVDYGDKGRRSYSAGDSLMEAVEHPHRGENRSDRPVRILVVFMGSEGTVNTKIVEE